MLKPSPSQRTQAYQYAMRNTASIVILSVVATVLVFGIGACIAIKPLTAIGLAPILAAISLIIQAIRGRPTHPHEPPKHPHHAPANMTAQPCQVPKPPTRHSSHARMAGPTEQPSQEMAPQRLDPQYRTDATPDAILTPADPTDLAQPIPDSPTAATGQQQATNPRRGPDEAGHAPYDAATDNPASQAADSSPNQQTPRPKPIMPTADYPP